MTHSTPLTSRLNTSLNRKRKDMLDLGTFYLVKWCQSTQYIVHRDMGWDGGNLKFQKNLILQKA
jgi:hypothetical protein